MTVKTKSKKIKLLIRGFISAIIIKLLHPKGVDLSESLIVYGSTRCGSTWLAEIISSISGNVQFFEPLNTTICSSSIESESREKYVSNGR